MQRVSSATIRHRKGSGLIPPNPQQWNVEHHALDIRERLKVPVDAPLDHVDAFHLLPGVSLLAHGEVPAAAEFIDYFRTEGVRRWSGMAITVGDGLEWVIYNDAHALTRIRATLMEEFFHLYFGHERTTIRVFSDNGNPRSFSKKVEADAYFTGAAALVPYVALKRMIGDGLTADAIARYFQVSGELVRFRAKVTKLYSTLRQRR